MQTFPRCRWLCGSGHGTPLRKYVYSPPHCTKNKSAPVRLGIRDWSWSNDLPAALSLIPLIQQHIGCRHGRRHAASGFLSTQPSRDGQTVIGTRPWMPRSLPCASAGTVWFGRTPNTRPIRQKRAICPVVIITYPQGEY